MRKPLQINYKHTKENVLGYIEQLVYIFYNKLFRNPNTFFQMINDTIESKLSFETDIEATRLHKASKLIETMFKRYGNEIHSRYKWFRTLNISGYPRTYCAEIMGFNKYYFSNFQGALDISKLKPLLYSREVYLIYRYCVLEPAKRFFIKINDHIWKEFIEMTEIEYPKSLTLELQEHLQGQ